MLYTEIQQDNFLFVQNTDLSLKPQSQTKAESPHLYIQEDP